MNDRIKVLLTTEGTYPFHQGGVSTWCDILVQKLQNEVDYVVYSIIMNPFVTQKFTLPERSELIKVPLWGTEEPSEHLTIPFSKVYIAKRTTTPKVIKDHFIPLFQELVHEIMTPEKDHLKFGNILYSMHEYFQEYEYKNSFKDELTWDIFKGIIHGYTLDGKNKFEPPNVYSMIQSLGWIYRFLNILNTPIPKVHVTHSAAAAFCGIPGILAKIKDKTPFMLTEHGVYLREQYLSLAQRKYSSFLNKFLIRMIHSVTGMNYAFADQVSPVCNYNTRWEKRFGVEDKAIKVIYNGVDKNLFSPLKSQNTNIHPTVVTVARIDPLKDIVTLMRSAAIVRESVPDVRFVVYGSVSVPGYYEQCLELRRELGLEETFIFAGHTTDVPSAYRSGDVIALSSISEAFPYSVVEAMMTGKPVVTTDVGGIKEAIGDTGFVVRPRNPEQLAEGIMKLLGNPELRNEIGEEARQRALNFFTIQKVLEMHLKSYLNLAVGGSNVKVQKRGNGKQRLLLDKGYLFVKLGMYEKAIEFFRMAIRVEYNSPAVPAILTMIAEAYNRMGEYDKAFHEMEKAEAITMLKEESYTA